MNTKVCRAADVGANVRNLIRIMAAVALAVISGVAISTVVSAPASSISGLVQSDNGTPISGAHVLAYNWDTALLAGEAHTTDNGTYSIDGLTLARYRVKADAPRYLPEYYREGTTTPVIVVPPYTTDNIDFTLTPGSSISGYVCQTDGLTPISGARVAAYLKIAGAWEYAADGYADSNGAYTITAGTGTYRVKAEAAGYAAEYYANVSDPAEATGIRVTAGGHIGGVSFTLAQIGFISGTVYEAYGLIPIPTAHVVAYDNATGDWVGDGFSDESAGYYYINLGPGTYRLKAEASGYLIDWYADVTSFGVATPVSVAGLNEKSDVNFTLETLTVGVTTIPADNVASRSARLNGNLTSLGSESDVTVSFIWGTAPGSYTHETPERVRDSSGPISFELVGLSPGTTYYYIAKADGHQGSVYGSELSFTTIDDTAPAIFPITCSTSASAATIMWITNETATSQIDYGLTEEYGESTGQDPNLVTTHIVTLTELKAKSTYHYRITSEDASNNVAISEDLTITTDVDHGRMEARVWKIIAFAEAAVAGVVFFYIWAKMIAARTPDGRSIG